MSILLTPDLRLIQEGTVEGQGQALGLHTHLQERGFPPEHLTPELGSSLEAWVAG